MKEEIYGDNTQFCFLILIGWSRNTGLKILAERERIRAEMKVGERERQRKM